MGPLGSCVPSLVKVGQAVLSEEHFFQKLMFGTQVDYEKSTLPEQNAEADVVSASISSTDPPISVFYPSRDLKKSPKVPGPFSDKKCDKSSRRVSGKDEDSLYSGSKITRFYRLPGLKKAMGTQLYQISILVE